MYKSLVLVCFYQCFPQLPMQCWPCQWRRRVAGENLAHSEQFKGMYTNPMFAFRCHKYEVNIDWKHKECVGLSSMVAIGCACCKFVIYCVNMKIIIGARCYFVKLIYSMK